MTTLAHSLIFRPVELADKDRILAFTAHTWGADEGDYIQAVFDDWFADPTGEFTAALIDDRVVAIVMLSDLGDGEWWFEGLRVDPAFRRRGMASALNRYHVELARKLGGKVIRYMTGGENVGSQAIGSQAGFQHTITFAAHLAAADDEFDVPLKLIRADVPAVQAWLDSPLMRYQHGAYRDAWSVKTLTESEIERVITEQRAYGLKQADGRIAAWAMVREDSDDTEDGERKRLCVDHLDGEIEAVTELAQQLRALAATEHRPEISAGISDYPPLIEAMTQAGYRLNPDHFGLWIMELAL
ncbi:MAG TPA: GNAT family N-acetyltransferase [Anaerolineae bacterium]|nr:GNAT family N-acetyltransferase [Anaerolineae bacterium]